MGCCTVKPREDSVVVRKPEAWMPLKVAYKERVLGEGEERYLTYSPKVHEYRARYKQFEYRMTKDTLVTVLDPRLGFAVEEIRQRVHQKQLGEATMYVVDGDECRNFYVIQRFKNGIEGGRTSLALYIAKLDPTQASYAQIIKSTLWSLMCTLAT
jgi:nitrogen regulatory protein PII